MKLLRNIWRDSDGQDLIEYTLLIGFLALGAAAIFLSVGGSVSGIWSSADNHLAVANSASTPLHHHGGDGGGDGGDNGDGH